MSDNEKSMDTEIEVTGSFKVKIGETELSLTKDQAEDLYTKLGIMLGKYNYSYPIMVPYAD